MFYYHTVILPLVILHLYTQQTTSFVHQTTTTEPSGKKSESENENSLNFETTNNENKTSNSYELDYYKRKNAMNEVLLTENLSKTQRQSNSPQNCLHGGSLKKLENGEFVCNCTGTRFQIL